MSVTIVPESLYFGAPVQLTVGGVEVGATLNAPKVGFEIEKYSPRFQNAGGPVAGAVRIKSVIPKLEVMVNELSAAKVARAMPGNTSVVGTAATTGGGASTDLDGAVVVGATSIVVTSATGISVGNYLKIGAPGETEIHKVAGVSGTTITLATPLMIKHRDADAVLEVDDAGTTIFTWTVGQVLESSHVDVEAIGPGVDGRQMRVLIKNALAGDSFSFDMGDNEYYGVPMIFTGHYDKDAPLEVPFEIEIG